MKSNSDANRNQPITRFRRALVLRPDSPKTWDEIGHHLQDGSLYKSATIAYQRVLIFEPGNDQIRKKLIAVLEKLDRRREAINQLSRLRVFDEQAYDKFCNYANWEGTFETLEKVVRRHGPSLPAMKRRSELAIAYYWRYFGRPDLERECFEAASAERRLSENANRELLAWTVRNDEEDAIARKFSATIPRDDRSATIADDIDPRNVTDIHSLDQEEGFNFSVDTVFSSFLTPLKTALNRPRLHVHQRCKHVFSRSFPWLDVRAYPPDINDIELGLTSIHVKDLPLLSRPFQTDADGSPEPHLLFDKELRDQARRRNLARSNGRPVVGLCWRSSRQGDSSFNLEKETLAKNEIDFDQYLHISDRVWRKCINLPSFSQLIENPDLSVVSMQYGLADWEANLLRGHDRYGKLWIDDIDHFSDLDVALAELAALDALVTIPCGYAHLSAAMGVPTFLLLHDQPPLYWVWNQRFPFYREVVTYEKPPEWQGGNMISRKYKGDWSPQIDSIVRDLERRFSATA